MQTVISQQKLDNDGITIHYKPAMAAKEALSVLPHQQPGELMHSKRPACPH